MKNIYIKNSPWTRKARRLGEFSISVLFLAVIFFLVGVAVLGLTGPLR